MKTEIELRGTLLSDEDAKIMRYFGWHDNCCPGDVASATASLPEGEELEVVINSGGGDLFAGKDLYFALKKAGARARVTTMSASAATVAMMGCREITADATSLFCIHDPTTWGGGNADALRKTAAELDTLKASIIDAYAPRLKRSRDEVWSLMSEDRWMNAQEALELGLIDRIAGEQTEPDARSVRILNAAYANFPTEKMRADYQAVRAQKEKDSAARENRMACLRLYGEILNKV